jgi:hypothetical protein
MHTAQVFSVPPPLGPRGLSPLLVLPVGERGLKSGGRSSGLQYVWSQAAQFAYVWSELEVPSCGS